MRFPLYEPVPVPQPSAFAAFGARRKHDVHTGVDLYAPVGTPVLAIEDGIVVAVAPFTGLDAGCPWWLPTDCVMVEGDSGVFIYGELETDCEHWEFVEAGQVIGRVLRVLRHNKGAPTSMLHLELYESGYRAVGSVWPLDGPRPPALLDPTPILNAIVASEARAVRGVRCSRCRAILPNEAKLAAHKAVCVRRPEVEQRRATLVKRLRERGAYLPPPETCPACGKRPELVTGATLYCKRPDLDAKMFWRCPDGCAHVGCHDGTSVPLGHLATEAERRSRMRAHAALDALWGVRGVMSRDRVYIELADRLGLPREACHIGRFDVATCERVIAVCAEMRQEAR